MSRYRLLDTTRAYAIEKLDESGERERLARCHAEYYRYLFERAEGEAPARPADEWLADYARKSTICARRSTGPFRRAAVDPSG
jgi:predicted ATPase